VRLKGHNVLPASANRRQVYVAIQDTTVTMSFRTWAQTVEDAEREFTDEYDRLLSHHNANVVVLTGEPT
jgi:hemolysin-activating ACP:hemolysin acyltransferase